MYPIVSLNNSAVLGRFLPKFKLIQSLMVVLINCKYVDDLIKKISARVVTTLYINFKTLEGS